MKRPAKAEQGQEENNETSGPEQEEEAKKTSGPEQEEDDVGKDVVFEKGWKQSKVQTTEGDAQEEGEEKEEEEEEEEENEEEKEEPAMKRPSIRSSKSE